MKHIRYLQLFVLIILMFVITACSNESSKNNQASPGTNETPPLNTPEQPSPRQLWEEASSKDVELTVFIGTGTYTMDNFMEEFGNFVQQKHPNLSFRLLVGAVDKQAGYIQDGEKFDVVQVQRASIQRLMLDFQLESDISDLIKKFNYDLSPIDPAILEEMRDMAGGGIYGLPYQSARIALIYNRDLFDRFAVPHPETGMTWDVIRSLSERISRQDGGVHYQGIYVLPRHYHLMNQLSEGYIDPVSNQVTFNTEKWQSIFRVFSGLYEHTHNPYFTNATTANNTFWKEERLGMIARMFVINPEMKTSTMNWDLVEIPDFPQNPKIGTGLLNYYFNVASTSKNREQAFVFAAALASEELQMQKVRAGTTPVLKTTDTILDQFAIDVPEFAGKNMKALLTATPAAPYKFSPQQGQIDAVIDRAFNAVATGEKDINTALRDAEEEAEGILKQTQ